MADGALDVQVVTPEGSLYAGPAAFVAAPATDGELGILPRHAPLIAQLGTGGLRIRTEEGPLAFAVRGGFVTVMEDRVTVLAAEAQRGEDVDGGALDAEEEEILAALRHPGTEEEFADLLDRRRWVEARRGLVE